LTQHIAIENSVVNGGSLTPQSQIGQINEQDIYARRLSFKQGVNLVLFLRLPLETLARFEKALLVSRNIQESFLTGRPSARQKEFGKVLA